MVKILTSPVQGDVPFGGHKATGLADPTSAQDAATKAYVDAVAQGLSVKASVRAASTANIASQSGLLTIDGVTLVDGDRVLAKDQTTGSTNGIWVAHSGAWTRATDADAGAELVAAFVFVGEGTTNADGGWVQTAAAPITVGTTALTWAQFSGAGQIVAGAGLAKSGNTLRRSASATGYANLAALPSAAANNGLLERTADGGIYESDGAAWQPVRDPSGTTAPALKRTAVKTTNYTAAPGDLVPVDTATPNANLTVTLPTAPTTGTRVAVKYVAVGTNRTVTIAAGGSDVFNNTGGPTTATLTLANQAVSLQYDSGIWTIVGDDLPLSQLDLRFAPKASPQFSGTLKVVANASPSVTPIIELDGFGRQFQGPMIDTSNAGGGRDLVLVDMFNFRRVSDLVIANGSVNVTSALQARFGIKDNGIAITGPGIPNGTTLVWVTGTDSGTAARLSQAATADGTITAVIGTNDGASLTDLFYVNEGGGQGMAFGFGWTPPPTTHRVGIAADDGNPAQGNLRLRLGPSQTGPIVSVIDSGGTLKTELGADCRWVGLVARCTDRTTAAGQVIVAWTDEVGGSQWAWSYTGAASSVLRLKYATGGVTALDLNTDGTTIFYKAMNIQGNLTFNDAKNVVVGTTTGTKIGTATTQKLGFFNATPVVQPSGTPAASTDLTTVIALANSLRTNLLALGLVA